MTISPLPRTWEGKSTPGFHSPGLAFSYLQRPGESLKVSRVPGHANHVDPGTYFSPTTQEGSGVGGYLLAARVPVGLSLGFPIKSVPTSSGGYLACLKILDVLHHCRARVEPFTALSEMVDALPMHAELISTGACP